MSTSDRRAKILNFLFLHRKTTVPTLMQQFHVSEATIRRDIRELMLKYPLESISGNGGGIHLAEWFSPGKNLLKPEEISALEEIIQLVNLYHAGILRNLLIKYGSGTYRKCEV